MSLIYKDFRRITKVEDPSAWKARRYIDGQGHKISIREYQKLAGSQAKTHQKPTPPPSTSPKVIKTSFKPATEGQLNRKRNENAYAEKTGKSINATKKDTFFRYNANLVTVDLKRLAKMEDELQALQSEKIPADASPEEKAAHIQRLQSKETEISNIRASLGETYRNLGRKRADDLTILGGSPH